MAQDPERDQREQDKEHDSDQSSCCADETDVNKPDPLEGLDEETKICFQVMREPFYFLRRKHFCVMM